MTFSLILVFRKVAINLAVVLEPNPFIVSSFDPEVNTNLSVLKDSVCPSYLISTYLSSSNGKNVSLSPATMVPVEFEEIVTINSFLMVKLEFAKSNVDIF